MHADGSRVGIYDRASLDIKIVRMSKAVKGKAKKVKAKKGSPYDLGNSNCPYDWTSSKGVLITGGIDVVHSSRD